MSALLLIAAALPGLFVDADPAPGFGKPGLIV